MRAGLGVVTDTPMMLVTPFFGADWGSMRVGLQGPLRIDIAGLQLRERDYDELNDLGRVVRFVEFGDGLLTIGRLHDLTLGNGTIVRRYQNNIDDDHPRTGVRLHYANERMDLDAFADNVYSSPVIAGRFGLVLGVFNLGATLAMDLAAPEEIDGTMDSAGNLNARVDERAVYGFDFAWTVADTPTFRAALTGDFNAIQNGNPGVHAGARAEFALDQGAWLTFLVEGMWFGKQYDWAIFDTGYLIDRFFLSWENINELPSGYGGRFGASLEAEGLSIGIEYANSAEVDRADLTAWAMIPHKYIRGRAFWRRRMGDPDDLSIGFDRTIMAASGGFGVAGLGWIDGTIARVWRTEVDDFIALYRPFTEVSVTLQLQF
jgi:hypothetical protein